MRQILIASPDPVETATWRDLLVRQENEVVIVTSGADLLTELKSFVPNLIICDSHLPDTSGYEICGQLKATKAFANMPVLIVSKYEEPSDILRCLESQCDGFMRKPIAERKFLVTVNNLASRHTELTGDHPRQGLPITVHGHTHFVDRQHQELLNLLLSSLVDRYEKQRDEKGVGHSLDDALDQLRVLYRRFAEVMDSHQDGIMIVNKADVVRRANLTAARLFGINPNNLVGKELSLDLSHGTVREITVSGPDGSEVPVLMKVEDFSWSGEPCYLVRLVPMEDVHQQIA